MGCCDFDVCRGQYLEQNQKPYRGLVSCVAGDSSAAEPPPHQDGSLSYDRVCGDDRERRFRLAFSFDQVAWLPPRHRSGRRARGQRGPAGQTTIQARPFIFRPGPLTRSPRLFHIPLQAPPDSPGCRALEVEGESESCPRFFGETRAPAFTPRKATNNITHARARAAPSLPSPSLCGTQGLQKSIVTLSAVQA